MNIYIGGIKALSSMLMILSDIGKTPFGEFSFLHSSFGNRSINFLRLRDMLGPNSASFSEPLSFPFPLQCILLVECTAWTLLMHQTHDTLCCEDCLPGGDGAILKYGAWNEAMKALFGTGSKFNIVPTE